MEAQAKVARGPQSQDAAQADRPGAASLQDSSPNGLRLARLVQLAAKTSAERLGDVAAILSMPRAPAPILQRQLNAADAAEKPSRMPDSERVDVDGFLNNNGHTAANYSQADYDVLNAAWGRVKRADDDVGNASSSHKRRQRVSALTRLYDALILDADAKNLDEGSAPWQAAVTAGVADYFGKPVGDQLNRNADYESVGEGLWKGRNTQPDAFWKAIRTACRVQHAAQNVDVAAATVSAVVAAANVRYRAYAANTAGVDRGAWAGSQAVGPRPADYVQTSGATIDLIRARQVAMGGALGTFWMMRSDSAPSGYALHRNVGGAQPFIYHL